MAPKNVILYHTITSPNTSTLVRILNDAIRIETKWTTAGFKIIYKGKNTFSLSILEIVPIDAKVWKRSESFNSLASTMQAQIDVHGTADLLSVISSEFPIDITTAYMESKKVK